jgi:chemotaxis protein methyltransferase CheR
MAAILRDCREEFLELIQSTLGLEFPCHQIADLMTKIRSAARDNGFNDAGSFMRRVLDAPHQAREIERLAGYFTVGESYFFREPGIFEILEHHIIPRIEESSHDGRDLRIWSAGCSTGEEPYSVAILLSRRFAMFGRKSFNILASDINPSALDRAKKGMYREWSFRGVSPELKERYFLKKGPELYEILPDIRKMVHFFRMNLAGGMHLPFHGFTNSLDLILCRNALMYLTPAARRLIIEMFFNLLAEGGWLVVGLAETALLNGSPFRSVQFPDAFVFRKERPGDPEHEHRSLTDTGSLCNYGINPLSFPAPEIAVSPELPPSEQPGRADSSPEGEPGHYEKLAMLFREGKYEDVASLSECPSMEHFKASDATAEISDILARSLANLARYAEAEQWCGNAIKRERLNPRHYFLMATILQEQQRIDGAMAALRTALYLDRHFAEASISLGNLYLQQGRARDAERHFNNALTSLRRRRPDAILPELEGITAGRLLTLVESIRNEAHGLIEQEKGVG